jgi:hypothetical protein
MVMAKFESVDEFLARGGSVTRVSEGVKSLDATNRDFYLAHRDGRKLGTPKVENILDKRTNVHKSGVVIKDANGQKTLED